MWKWEEDDESIRWEGPPEEKDMSLEQYLWSRVKRVELALAEANREIYKLNKARAQQLKSGSLLPPPIGGA